MSFRIFTLMMGTTGILALAACKHASGGGTGGDEGTGGAGTGTGTGGADCPFDPAPKSQDSCDGIPDGTACTYSAFGELEIEVRTECTCSGTTHTWSCCLGLCADALGGIAGPICASASAGASAYASLVACASASCSDACGSLIAGQGVTQGDAGTDCADCLTASCDSQWMACDLN